MVPHIFSLLSAPAYLAGIVCLALGLARAGRPACADRLMPCAPVMPDAPCRSAPVPRAAWLWPVSGIGCVLIGFLLLPIGSFPAYIPCELAVPVWLVLFSMGCVALGIAENQRVSLSDCAAHGEVLPAGVFRPGLISRLRTHPQWVVLGTPLVLGLVFAVCARYAWLHGFPGTIWAMEVYVALPLYTGADPVRVLGFGCLAMASVLQGTTLPSSNRPGAGGLALPAGGATRLLRACVRLAAAQFTVCLLFPLLLSRLWALPAVPAVVLDEALHWLLVLGLYLGTLGLGTLSQGTLRVGRFFRLCVPVLLGLGAGLCLG